MSDSVWSHELRNVRLPYSSPSPGACSNSGWLSQWCHPTSVIPFSSYLQSFPASGSFLMSQLFSSGGQNIGASVSVLPMNIQDCFALELTGLISLQSKVLSKLCPTPKFKSCSSKEQASFNFMAVVTIHSDFEAQGNKVCHCFHFFLSICHEVMELGAMIFVFWILNFKLAFSLFSFTFIKRLFSSSSLSAIKMVSSAYLRLLIFLLAILILAYASSSPAFLMTYSAYKLNKQGDNI